MIFYRLTVLTISDLDILFVDEIESVSIRNFSVDENQIVFTRNIFINLLITGWLTFTFSYIANFGFYTVHPRKSSK